MCAWAHSAPPSRCSGWPRRGGAESGRLRQPLAYLAASSACVALLGFYLRHPLGSGLRAALFTILFAALYAALYVLLKSEDHALLLGSLLVFGVLAGTMLLTRRLDWGGLSRRLAPAPAAADV